MAVGCVGGFGGFLAGTVAGIFVELVVSRILEERKLRRTVTDGMTSASVSEPFAGALYCCALGVYGCGDEESAAAQAKKYFGGAYEADWHTLCRSAGRPSEINADFVTECLASVLCHEMKRGEVPLPQIFQFLEAAERYWDEERQGAKPSVYLAKMLDYTVISDELRASYQVLGLFPDASADEVKAAHRRLATQFHPDSESGDRERFLQIQTAYETIRKSW